MRERYRESVGREEENGKEGEEAGNRTEGKNREVSDRAVGEG